MNTHTPIEFLLFDLGNVIIDLDLKRTEKAILALTGLPYDGFHQKVHAVFTKYETGKINEELFINALLKEAKSPKTDARTILNTWNSMLLGITKEKITLLRELKERYTLCALSNTNKTHMDWVRDHLRETHQLEDLESIFDHLFLSHEINERKPDTSYFLHVLKELDADPSAMLFIDDHLDHVQTAISMGIPSIHKPANVALDRSFLKRSGIE